MEPDVCLAEQRHFVYNKERPEADRYADLSKIFRLSMTLLSNAFGVCSA